jgi:glycine cleavage system H protein
MTMPGAESVSYKRARFSTRLPVDRRYTASHFWLLEESPGVWRIGFTKFATRMLGDLVEYELSVKTGTSVEIGQEIGSVEGFKAVTALYSVAEGQLLGIGDAVSSDITIVESDPYNRGWLYRVKGRPDPESVDVQGYVAVLDATIDKMLETRHAVADAGSEADAKHDKK